MATVWCSRNDITDVVGEAAVLACIDDNQDGIENTSESAAVTNAIERAAVEMNNTLCCQYILSDLLNNSWCKWCNTYLAIWHLFSRRANVPPASVVDYVQTCRDQLSEIRWGRFQVPEGVSSIEHTPAVSNFNVEMNNDQGPVVVDGFRSTGAEPNVTRKRHRSNYL